MMKPEVYAAVIWALVMATYAGPALYHWAVAVHGARAPACPQHARQRLQEARREPSVVLHDEARVWTRCLLEAAPIAVEMGEPIADGEAALPPRRVLAQLGWLHCKDL